MLGIPQVCAVFQVGSPKGGVKSKNQFLALLVTLLLMWPRTQLALHTLLAHVQFVINHHRKSSSAGGKSWHYYGITVLTSWGQAGRKSVNKLHWYSYTYNHTSYKISFGWVMSRYSFTHHGFHSKTSPSRNNFKEIRQKTLLPLCNLYQQKKIVILTQKFLRFVFPVQRWAVTKVSIVPSWRCCHFLT